MYGGEGYETLVASDTKTEADRKIESETELEQSYTP